MKKTIFSLFCLTLFIVHPISYAQTYVSVFGGYRNGGEFQVVTTGERLKVDEGESLGISLSIPYSKNTKIELLFSHQESQLLNSNAPTDVLVDLDIDYFHYGGIYTWPDDKIEPYIVGTIGATHYSPGGSYDDKFRASLGFGVGTYIHLSKGLALKFEARGFSTFLDSGGAMFCNDDGCRVIAVSSTIWQSELQAGLTFKY